MKTFATVVLSSSLLFLAGCGAPRFDASSDAAVDESMERLSKGMSQDEKEKFGQAVTALTMMDGLSKAFGVLTGQEPATPAPATPGTLKADLFKPLQGLTAAEIVARADGKTREFEERARR
jgi:hypothetical protein